MGGGQRRGRSRRGRRRLRHRDAGRDRRHRRRIVFEVGPGGYGARRCAPGPKGTARPPESSTRAGPSSGSGAAASAHRPAEVAALQRRVDDHSDEPRRRGGDARDWPLADRTRSGSRHAPVRAQPCRRARRRGCCRVVKTRLGISESRAKRDEADERQRAPWRTSEEAQVGEEEHPVDLGEVRIRPIRLRMKPNARAVERGEHWTAFIALPAPRGGRSRPGRSSQIATRLRLEPSNRSAVPDVQPPARRVPMPTMTPPTRRIASPSGPFATRCSCTGPRLVRTPKVPDAPRADRAAHRKHEEEQQGGEPRDRRGAAAMRSACSRAASARELGDGLGPGILGERGFTQRSVQRPGSPCRGASLPSAGSITWTYCPTVPKRRRSISQNPTTTRAKTGPPNHHGQYPENISPHV